ncbi:MAG: putative amidohydrolase [Acidimicrobiia bacterium]|nr:putative amidohydrolase [Acidimicrobiia bacterium]
MSTTVNADEVLAGLSIVDCDAHFTEPPDLWTSRATKAQQDQMPVMKTEGGVSAWHLGNRVLCSIGGNTLQRGLGKQLGTLALQPFDIVDESSWDVKARLALMDEMGIYAQVLFPNAIGFASNTMFSIKDVQQRTLIQQIYNDFLVDIQAESGNRLLPQAVLPVWDMDLTVKEMKRLGAQGITGFTLSDKPHTVGLPDLDAPYFAPMWEVANEMGSVFNFHIGSGFGPTGDDDPVMAEIIRTGNPVSIPNPDLYWESFGPQRRLAILATQFYMSNARIIVNLCMSNIFDRYPNVKINSAESGIGWVPFILESMEYQLDEMVTDPKERALQTRRPTEYFQGHIYVTFWFEKVGPLKLIPDIGVNNVLVETDVPHPTCIYPGARQRIADVMSQLDAHTRQRVLQDNAAELFGIKLP